MAVRALAAIVLLAGLAHAQIECGGDSGVLCPPADQIGIAPDTNCVNGVSTFKNLFGVVAFDGASYDGRCSFFGGTPALDEGLGWFIVVGLGGVFSLAVSFCMWISERAIPSRHQDEQHTSEHFASAGRTMSAGLCACDIVSKWTWAATLLQSSNVAWQYGISGPFWYAAGATIQVLLFSVLAVEIKRKCPAIHTVLEIVLARWGTVAHLTFLVFCIMTNFLVTAMLILGGAAVVSALSGVNIYAASFLIPLSVVFYTAQGGLLATFVSSWGHVAVIYIALIIFLWKVYVGPSELGSTDKVWENLQSAAIKFPVPNNFHGTFLTMWSRGGLIFGIINIIGNFGTVFVDQSYWQGAIAARPSATYKGYLLGGIAWFAIPFSMATTLGLASRALDLPLTATEAGAGLVPPAVAVHLLGPGGAFLITFQLFMAVTATGSAEQIAVASLFAYDVWKRYFKPSVTGKELIFISRIMIFVWSILSGVLSVILLELNIGLGWVYLCMGNFIGSAVVPIAFAITWRNCSATGAVAGAMAGLVMAMVGWISVAASLHDGVINAVTLGDDLAFLCGNVLALTVSPIVCVIISLIKPQNYNWEDLRTTTDSYLIEEDRHAHGHHGEDEDSEEAMTVALRWTYITGGILSFVLIIAWPLLTLPQYNFTKSYWGWWVAIAFIWGHVAAIITIILPLWEARDFLLAVVGLKKYDFSATVRGREGYDPTGPVAYVGETKPGEVYGGAPIKEKDLSDQREAPSDMGYTYNNGGYPPNFGGGGPGMMMPPMYPQYGAPPPGMPVGMYPPMQPGMGYGMASPGSVPPPFGFAPQY